MQKFTSKEEMIAAWVANKAYEIQSQGTISRRDAEDLARIMAAGEWVYVPHVYRGGYVIRGFGYSTERIGKFISEERAGNPLAV